MCPNYFCLNYFYVLLSFFSGCGCAMERGFAGFFYFSGTNHAGCDPHAFDGTLAINDLDALKVWFNHAQCLSYDLGTGTALAADHTASFIFTP